MSFARAPIRRANSSRARSLSVKKSSVVISHGADLRLRPSIPAASTEFNCGDIYAQFRYVMSSGMRNRWRWFSITVLIAALFLWFAQIPQYWRRRPCGIIAAGCPRAECMAAVHKTTFLRDRHATWEIFHDGICGHEQSAHNLPLVRAAQRIDGTDVQFSPA